MKSYRLLKECEAIPVYLDCVLPIRYFEDSEINGVPDDENKPQMPLLDNGVWRIIIDLSTGKILNWTQGVTAKIHYKVCDEGTYTVIDVNVSVLFEHQGYVPDCLSVGESGYGDYVIMSIDETGKIKDFDADLSDIFEQHNQSVHDGW